MSDDYQGLAAWLDGFLPNDGSRPGGPQSGGPQSRRPRPGGFAAIPEQGGEPAYPTSFGWTPTLVPLPRRSPEELF